MITKNRKILTDSEVAGAIQTEGRKSAVWYWQNILDRNDWTGHASTKKLTEYKLKKAKTMTPAQMKKAMSDYSDYING